MWLQGIIDQFQCVDEGQPNKDQILELQLSKNEINAKINDQQININNTTETNQSLEEELKEIKMQVKGLGVEITQ